MNSRAILRTLDSHKQPVHVAKFSTLTPTQVLTCSDDTTTKIWDVPSQAIISTLSSHTDYVRTGQFSNSNPNLVLTGSYDATVKLFDLRTGDCELTMGNPGAGAMPVEQVAMFPSGTVAVSSSGPILRTWDIVAGGRCTRALSNHQKTVTSLAFNSNSSRLLTGGLDQMVKVYDVSTYKVVHTMRYPAPILCLAISVCSSFLKSIIPLLTSIQPDDTHIAAGMTDGTLSVRRRQPKPSAAAAEDPFGGASLRSGAYETFLGATNLGAGTVKGKGKSKAEGDINEFRVESKRVKRLKEYDRLLKSFKYSAALDSVLKKVRFLANAHRIQYSQPE